MIAAGSERLAVGRQRIGGARLLFALALTAIWTSGSRAAVEVSVTRVDGTQVTGSLESISDGMLRLDTEDGAVVAPIDEIMRIAFPGQTVSLRMDADCTFHLASGGSLSGWLLDGESEAIVARTELAERTRLPFASLSAIAFNHREADDEAGRLFQEAMANRLPGEDVLITANEGRASALRGTLTALGPEDGEFVFRGKARRLRTDKVFAVVFAAGVAEGPSRGVAVQLAGGGSFSGLLTAATEAVVRIQAAFGQAVELPLESLGALEFRSDRVVFVSDLVPVSQHYSGLVHEDWPFREDRNVFNGPIRLGGREYPKGLGVHARQELGYELGGEYVMFAATIGIDDAARPGGNVEFKVFADGRLVFESGPVTGADRPRDIRVPVDGAGRLTLTVEFGENADVGDWADWASARLIKAEKSG